MEKMLSSIEDTPFGFDPEAEAEYEDNINKKLEYYSENYKEYEVATDENAELCGDVPRKVQGDNC